MIKPFRFYPCRVLRLYRGGSGIDSLCGSPHPADSRFPESWIASCIEGNGRAYHSRGHGLSLIDYEGTPHLFAGFLHEHAEDCLGAEHLAAFGETPAGTRFLSTFALPTYIIVPFSSSILYTPGLSGKRRSFSLILSLNSISISLLYPICGLFQAAL